MVRARATVGFSREAQSAWRAPKKAPEKRGHEWRPGGGHEDRRRRFKKESRFRKQATRTVNRPARVPESRHHRSVGEALVVWHLVLMKPRADLSPSDGRRLVDTFRHALENIPTIREVRVARRVRHGAGYETRAPDSADFLISLGFDDLDGLQRLPRSSCSRGGGGALQRSL